jgi:hypothetical protein
LSAQDANNKLVFQKQFSKPSNLSIPLADNQPYEFSLGLLNKKTFQTIVTLDKELVSVGLSEISLSMLPKKGTLTINALTDKNKEVPFQISLLNADNKTIWQQEFTAPLTKEITANVNETGTMLRLSPIVKPYENIIKSSELKVSYHPNPVADKLTLELTAEKETPVHFAIYTLQGELVQQKILKAPGTHVIDVATKKQGLYVLSIRSGEKELKKLIELK